MAPRKKESLEKARKANRQQLVFTERSTLAPAFRFTHQATASGSRSCTRRTLIPICVISSHHLGPKSWDGQRCLCLGRIAWCTKQNVKNVRELPWFTAVGATRNDAEQAGGGGHAGAKPSCFFLFTLVFDVHPRL